VSKRRKSERMHQERTCVACRTHRHKYDMLRIVQHQDDISIDVPQVAHGRGCYVCKQDSCVQLCIKRRSLSRAFGCQVTDSVYNVLERELV
jgi:predicted RNA-binding protein YlxR (DUF448 family)